MRKKMLCKAARVCMAMGLTGVLVWGSGTVSPGAMEEYPETVEMGEWEDQRNEEETEDRGTQESVEEVVELELAEEMFESGEEIWNNSNENIEENVQMSTREAGQESEQEEVEDSAETKTADLKLTAEAEPETARAGGNLLYDVCLENTGKITLIQPELTCSLDAPELTGTWEAADGNFVNGNSGDEKPAVGEPLTAENLLPMELQPGGTCSFYLNLVLPEEQIEPVSLKLTASAKYTLTETASVQVEESDIESKPYLEDTTTEKITFDEEIEELTSEKIGGENDRESVSTPMETITRELTLTTEITPLKADFEVTKTADRPAAAPGDRVLFQICIRNTGERTLHSVLTTERFQEADVSAAFLAADGVQIDETGTKALIPQIAPGDAASLQAEVTIPENMESRELINEITVVTAETGEREVTSQAKIQIIAPTATPAPTQPEEIETLQSDNPAPPAAETHSESYPASTRPKTGDTSETASWLGLSFAALLMAVTIRAAGNRKDRHQ